MMKRVLVLLVFLMMAGALLGLPASSAGAVKAAARGEGCAPLFSLAPTAQAYAQTSPDDPLISGTARNRQGAAVAGVSVVAENPSTHAVVASAVTDAAGAYSLAVPSGTYDLKATPPPASGLGSGTYPGVAAAGDVKLDILFMPADLVTFSGRVLDRDGTPIPNQTVYLKRTPFGRTGTTDAQGYFSLKVPPGDYTLEVISGLFNIPPDVPSSYSVSRSGTVTLTQNTTMDITLNEVYVTGKVVDPLGLIPVGGSQVHLSGSTTFGAFSGSFESYATCDSAGNYAAVIMPCSSLTIEATPPELSLYAYGKATGVSMLTDGSKNVNVPLGVTFSGVLKDRDGTPIPDQSVSLKQTGFAKSGITNDLGYFLIKVPAGTYTVEVSNGFLTSVTNAPTTYQLTRSSTVNLTIGMVTDLTIAEVYVTGKVLSPTGNAVPDVQVHFGASGTFGSFTGKFDSYATSDSAGNYSAVILPSSNLTIDATPPEAAPYAYTRLEGQSIIADASRNITLATGIVFSGTLTDRDGTPLTYQYVQVKKSDFSKLIGSNGSGVFSARIPAGVYSLEVLTGWFGNPPSVPSSYQLAETGTISLTADTTRNITLSEVYVQGKVVDPSGALASGVALAMSGNGTSGTMSGKFDSRVTTDGWGSFNATLFPSAAVTLEATPQEANGYGPAQAVNLDVSQDKSLLIILNDSYDGTPPAAVTNLTVGATYDVSASLSWASPGDNGTYGKASAYDIRYSTSPITEANWAAAAQCTGEPAPKTAGQPETFLVPGLSPSTTYYFALKTADEANNWSGLSNVPTGTTQAFVNLTVTGISPANVPQFSWWVNLEISGAGFKPGATVKLMMSDAAIEASSVNVVSDTKLTCTVFILAQSPGFYDVLVTNPGGKQARLYFAFSIGASCGQGSGAAVLAFGTCLGLLSLAGSTGLRRRRKRHRDQP